MSKPAHKTRRFWEKGLSFVQWSDISTEYIEEDKHIEEDKINICLQYIEEDKYEETQLFMKIKNL